MFNINKFNEAANSYMSVKIEQIYLNSDVKSACAEVSQIIITHLEKNNIELDSYSKTLLMDEIFDEMLNSLDVIISYAYKSGFSDALDFKKKMQEGE